MRRTAADSRALRTAEPAAVHPLDPRSPAWAAAVGRHAGAHLAHAPEWAAIVAAAYGHQGRAYGTADVGGLAVLGAVEIRRPLLGARLVSMPFLDGGGPLATTTDAARALLAHLSATARAAGASTVEIRCAERLPVDAAPWTHKANLSLSLPPTPDALWRALSPKVRNQVRKADRSQVTVREGGPELLDAFYGVFAANMRDLGSPPHSRAFFASILGAFGPRARVLLVEREGDTLGGLLALAFRDTLYVPWASCLRRHAALCPNMLLYWGALERAAREGFRRFDFGRSTVGSGTYRFKQQWGAEERPLYWYVLPLDGRAAPREPQGTTLAQRAAWVWQRLPVALTRRLGPRIRRYLPQ